MNHAQFALFIVYVLSVWCAGAGLYALLNGKSSERLNNIVYVGEALLLGNIFLVGELLILSVAGLFHTAFLWSAVGANFLFLCHREARRSIFHLFSVKWACTFPGFLFIAIVLIFVFRNCYFLIDVDSVSTYLYAQKLWLQAGTSLIGNSTFDVRVFNPQYDAIAYSLGLSIFGQETLFPELVTVFWRVICLVLIFGYTTYRFNGYYGLATVLFVVLNGHFFYAGSNKFVIINAAIIAFMFASTYNFWEAKSKNNVQRLFFALLFLSQIPGCKLYTVYATLFLLIFGLCIQKKPLEKVKAIFSTKKYLVALTIAVTFTLLWYVKNFLITKDPLFPFLSGKMHFFGWNSDQLTMLWKAAGGLSPWKVLKYSSFLFIWPGVNAAKYVLIGLLTLPLVAFSILARNDPDKKDGLTELCFWLGASLLLLCGICMALWQDPRPYRFPMAVFSFTAVFYLQFVLRQCFNCKWEFIIIGVLILLSLQGFRIIKNNNEMRQSPSVKDNINVLLDRLHMDDIIKKDYPEVLIIREGLKKNQDKINASAWFVGENSNAFFLPHRPWISVFFSTTISWDSYVSEDRIIAQLRAEGIKWVMVFEPGSTQLEFVPVEKFSHRAMQFDRHPNRTLYDYGFPSELTKIN